LDGDGDGLERCDLEGVPRPIIVAAEDAERGSSTVNGFEHGNKTTRQFVITLE